MEKHYISVPEYLVFENTIHFINSFKLLNEQRLYVFDFKNLRRIDPFSILLLSSELEIFKKNNPESKFSAKNFEHCTYAAHMGFFQSFGLDFGKFPGEAKNNNRYIPLKIYTVSDIKQSARDALVNPGEILEDFAREISTVLTQNTDKNLADILRYCIREIFRNIVEHSNTTKFGFCAQYLPSLNKVSFSVLDRGMGIKNSLSENPELNLNDDLTALKESLKPGISGKTYPSQLNKPTGEWANSGFGLFMTSSICKNGGSFFIASGESGIYLSQGNEKILNVNIQGSALNLTINLDKKEKFREILANLHKEIKEFENIKASKSSLDILE
ncbi:hypothetical protein [Flavobacterium difficile]|uniref:ATP-binding protein n=1 Tax=Flavobacterium difficile TaxID=2709659 RepID=A0ABX0I8Q7_9FLAO|nr:hypothetical protein [Flavobacterium difficile]NHM02593.1 hypothetical protein [Flavobacterium difficile]